MEQEGDPALLLKECQEVRQAIFRLVGSSRPEAQASRRLEELPRILRLADRPKREIKFSSDAIGEFREEGVIPPDVAMSLDEIVLRCQLDLEAYLRTAYHVSLPVKDPYAQTKERLMTALRDNLRLSVAETRNVRVDKTLDIIRDKPGLYIRQISDWFNRLSRENLTYSAIWDYVNELAAEGEILTIGGPQGSPKYCFPRIREPGERARYYHMPFGVQGTIEGNVSERFVAVSPREFKEFYLLSQEDSEPVLLVVTHGALHNVSSGEVLKTFGNLQPFPEVVRNTGFVYEDGEQLRNLDGLMALKVAAVDDDEERQIWVDSELLKKKSLYPSILGPRT